MPAQPFLSHVFGQFVTVPVCFQRRRPDGYQELSHRALPLENALNQFDVKPALISFSSGCCQWHSKLLA